MELGGPGKKWLAFEMAKKTNLIIQVSLGLPYLQELVIFGHEC